MKSGLNLSLGLEERMMKAFRQGNVGAKDCRQTV